MRRRTLAIVVAAAFASFAVAGSSRSQVQLPPLAGASDAKLVGPLFASVQRYSPKLQRPVSVLARVDPRSLRPLAGRRVTLGMHWAGWAFSPDRSMLVVARDNGSEFARSYLRFVDVAAMRIRGEIRLGPGYASALVWPRPDRVLTLQNRWPHQYVVVADPVAGRILRREAVVGDVVETARTPSGLVLLVSPSNSIAPSKLVVVDADGNIREARLDRLWAGFERPADDVAEADFVAKNRVPGLAIDSSGDRAFVVPADGPVAEVDLASLAVAYHDLSRPVSLLGRLHEWLEPSARAKAIEGPVRGARWLGGGLLAMSGSDYGTYLDARGKRQSWGRPAGVQIIDTRAWTIRMLDPGGNWFTQVGGDLLVSGSSWDSASSSRRGIGLAEYAVVTPMGEFDGGKRFQVMDGKAALIELVYGTRAYVRLIDRQTPEPVLRIVDLTAGRIVGKRTTPLPYLLIDE